MPKRLGNLAGLVVVSILLPCQAANNNIAVVKKDDGWVDRPAVKSASKRPIAAKSVKEPPRMVAKASRDLFSGKTWKPPPPPPPPPPPKPVAPPFPFVYSGSMRDVDGAGEAMLFLSQGNRNFVVRKGETLSGSYRLDEISERQAVFTYLPLQEKQRLVIGNPQ